MIGRRGLLGGLCLPVFRRRVCHSLPAARSLDARSVFQVLKVPALGLPVGFPLVGALTFGIGAASGDGRGGAILGGGRLLVGFRQADYEAALR